jgi:hypothetical protein
MSERLEIPPVSMLLGSSWNNYFKILKDQDISPEYKNKVRLTTLIVMINTPFHWWEKAIYNQKKLESTTFKKPPVFILGHWRSGTTLLHNMLCKDPRASYVTTYQTVYPNNLASKLIFRSFMKVAMPDRRPADNMKLNVSYPQEDEFALSNMYHNNYYNFYYFPNNYKEYYNKSVRFEGLTHEEREEWKKNYEILLKKAYLNVKGERQIIKNPVNTARIRVLLEMYPDARFLFIYRNPITVFLSTQKFFRAILQSLMLHKVDNDFIDQMILEVYQMLMDDYLEYKALIPEGNLYELRYESFEKDPVEYLRIIYDELIRDEFDIVEDSFVKYFESTKGHIKQKYEVDKSVIDLVQNNWGKYMELFNYEVPKEIIIKQ